MNSRNIGEYEVLEKLGEGGMGAVYKARHLRTQQIVAIKVASRAVLADATLSRRFELEFSVVHPLSHRHLVEVIEYGVHGDLPFLVMEYVDGPSLSQHIAAKGALREHEAISILLPIAEALKYLHGRNLIHRDVKPANILVTSQGVAKLADLGLIKNLEAATLLTRPNAGLGTIQFSPPEQFKDAASADPRSDVYSLAATFYSCIVGEFPFGKGSMTEVVQRKLKNQFEAPSKRLPSLRPSVDAAIRLGMHADPKNRPASIGDFVALLTGWKKVPLDAPLPGIAAKVDVEAKVSKKATHERRVKARFGIEVSGTCRAVGAPLAQRWDTTIADISTTGLCLQSTRRFEPGSKLEVTFCVQPDGSALSRVVRVCWSSAQGAKWLLGCEFVSGMTDEDLETIFVDLLGRTKMA